MISGFTIFTSIKSALDNLIKDDFETCEILLRRRSDEKFTRAFKVKLLSGVFISIIVDDSEEVIKSEDPSKS